MSAAAVFLILVGSASPSSTADGVCIAVGGIERPATINGTPANDILLGTPGPDVIAGNGGDDTIDGLGGDDLICGGDGNDNILGGDGIDDLSGDAGQNAIDGGPNAQFSSDFVLYDAAPGPVAVDLTLGTATGWGTDTIIGVEGISGSGFDDSLTGRPADDWIIGQSGNDTLNGMDGADLLSGSLGDDVVIGGPGEDTAYYWFAPRSISASLATRRGSGWGSDRFVGIEDLDGSDFADRLTGNGGSNFIRGFAGKDIIVGGGGPTPCKG